jgi:putative transposase
MRKDAPFVPGETYHLFNRGAHKQDIFTTEAEYRRFLLLLHLANSEEKLELRPILRRHRGQTSVIFRDEKPTKGLVNVQAYCLMPNHFHLILQEKTEAGITKFMRKVLTAYSMYFNILHQHSGVLAQGAFKSKHINSENYFRYIFSYVHLNPLSLHIPEWEKKGIENIVSAREFMYSYPYSSFYDYIIGERPESAIVEREGTPDFLKTQDDLEGLLRWYDQGLTLVT